MLIENSIKIHQNRRLLISRWKLDSFKGFLACFALYSLLPALAKLSGVDAFFLINIPIILFLLIGARLSKLEFISIAVMILIIFVQLLLGLIGPNNFSLLSFLQSVYIWIFPMLGFFVAKRLPFDDIAKIIFFIAIIHAFIGIATSDIIQYPEVIRHYISIVKEGSAFFRMSSVAGSLIFGVLMASGFNSYLYLYSSNQAKGFYNIAGVVVLLAGFLSLQRSCWIAMTVGILFVSIQGSKKLLLSMTLGAIAIPSILLTIKSNQFYFDRFMTLFSSDYNPIDERMMLYVSAINHISGNFFGGGIGQAGIIGHMNHVVFPAVITDGDYLKIMVEGGILFFILYFAIIAILTKKLISLRMRLSCVSVFAILVGFLVQMIGSNISEFYFVNFIFWFFAGGVFYNFKTSYHKVNNDFPRY